MSALTLLSRGVAHVIDQGLAWFCSTWSESGPHADGSPHFGGVFALDLALAEPGQVTGTDGITEVSEFLDIRLWQKPGQPEPVIGVRCSFGERELPDMTLAEAETLALAVISLVGRAWVAA